VSIPRVSVIIPAYNRSADVARCLDSLLVQTFKEFEVIVCDDGSTDDTAAVVDGYKSGLDLIYHWEKNWGGPARPRNAGLQRSRGTYVAFLDSDDWWAPRKLERSVRELDRGADVVYHDLYLARSSRSTRRLLRASTRALTSPVYRCLLERGNALTNSSVVVRRGLLTSIGGMTEDPQLVSWEDYDCWLRLARVTEKFTHLREPLGWYWCGGGNVSSPRRTLQNLRRIREIYLRPAGLGTDETLPGWYHYAMGRGYFHQRDYSRAIRHMRRAIRGSLRPGVRAKALVTLGESLMYKGLGREASQASDGHR
jgi:glycosyltransferase involved in cell wall biosynthesis